MSDTDEFVFPFGASLTVLSVLSVYYYTAKPACFLLGLLYIPFLAGLTGAIANASHWVHDSFLGSAYYLLITAFFGLIIFLEHAHGHWDWPNLILESAKAFAGSLLRLTWFLSRWCWASIRAHAPTLNRPVALVVPTPAQYHGEHASRNYWRTKYENLSTEFTTLTSSYEEAVRVAACLKLQNVDFLNQLMNAGAYRENMNGGCFVLVPEHVDKASIPKACGSWEEMRDAQSRQKSAQSEARAVEETLSGERAQRKMAEEAAEVREKGYLERVKALESDNEGLRNGDVLRAKQSEIEALKSKVEVISEVKVTLEKANQKQASEIEAKKGGLDWAKRERVKYKELSEEQSEEIEAGKTERQALIKQLEAEKAKNLAAEQTKEVLKKESSREQAARQADAKNKAADLAVAGTRADDAVQTERALREQAQQQAQEAQTISEHERNLRLQAEQREETERHGRHNAENVASTQHAEKMAAQEQLQAERAGREAIEAEVRSLKARKVVPKEQYDQIKAQYHDEKGRAEAMQECYDTADETLKETEAMRKQQEDRAVSAEAQASMLQHQINNHICTQHGTQPAQSEAVIQAQVAQLQQQLSSKNTELEKRERDLRSMGSQLAMMAEQVRRQQQTQPAQSEAGIPAQVAQLQQQIAYKNQQISSKDASLEKQDRYIESMEARVEKMAEQVKRQQAAPQQQAALPRQRASAGDDGFQVIADLEHEAETLRAKIDELEFTLGAYEGDETLRQQLETLELNIQTVEIQRDEANDLCDEQTDEINKLNVDLKDLEKLRQEKADLLRQVAALNGGQRPMATPRSRTGGPRP